MIEEILKQIGYCAELHDNQECDKHGLVKELCLYTEPDWHVFCEVFICVECMKELVEALSEIKQEQRTGDDPV